MSRVICSHRFSVFPHVSTNENQNKFGARVYKCILKAWKAFISKKDDI